MTRFLSNRDVVCLLCGTSWMFNYDLSNFSSSMFLYRTQVATYLTEPNMFQRAFVCEKETRYVYSTVLRTIQYNTIQYNTYDLQILEFHEITCQNRLLTCCPTTTPIAKIINCQWRIGETILTGENWSAGRKTIYSVGGRWMNEYGALVEWYWQGKLKCWEKNIIQSLW